MTRALAAEWRRQGRRSDVQRSTSREVRRANDARLLHLPHPAGGAGPRSRLGCLRLSSVRPRSAMPMCFGAPIYYVKLDVSPHSLSHRADIDAHVHDGARRFIVSECQYVMSSYVYVDQYL